MSTISGNAAGYFDLLTILRNFLINTGHAWGLTYSGVGTGRLNNAIGTSTNGVQTITVTAINATTFTVVGSVSGALANATVGTPYTSAVCGFTITAGGTAFQSGDVFTFNLSPRWTSLRWGGCGEAALRTASSGAAALFDNATGANAVDTTTLPHVTTVQMQAATEIRSFAIWSGSTTATAPQAFNLQWSDDGVSYTTAQSWSSQTWPATFARRDFVLSSAPGAHLYWRLNVTAANSATLRMAEIALYPDTSGKWNAGNSFQFAMRAPGVDGAQQIHLLGTTNVNAGAGFWNLVFRSVRFWTDQELDIANIPLVSSTHAHLLNTNTIAYWIVAHGGRVILMTRVSGIYEISYIGFGLPYETPTNHPHPLIVAAPSNSTSRLFSDTNSAYRNPYEPGPLGVEVMIPSGLWREISNRDSSTSVDGGTAGAGTGKVWPYAFENTGANGLSVLLREAVDGTRPILPAVIVNGPDAHTWGEFDGIHWTSGFGNSPESLTRIGALDYIAIPNVFRTSAWHYGAVALD